MTTLPIGSLIDCPAEIAGARPPLIKRMCARCSLVLGWVVCTPENDGAVSHGACPACFEAQMTEIADWAANLPVPTPAPFFCPPR